MVDLHLLGQKTEMNRKQKQIKHENNSKRITANSSQIYGEIQKTPPAMASSENLRAETLMIHAQQKLFPRNRFSNKMVSHADVLRI